MNWLVVRLLGVLVLGALAAGCRCGHGPNPGTEEAEIGSPPLSARDIEGEDPPEAPGRCLPVNGARSVIFRERDEEIEVGADVSWAEGFAVALSRQGPSGRPSVFIVRDGKTEEVKLPEAEGGAPPPELAVEAGALFALSEGADAGGSTLDLYRLSMEPGSVPAKPRSLALEHRLFESRTLAATGDQVLVAWDVRDRASDVTSIRVEVFRSADLNPVRPSFGLVGHGLDAASPEALGHEGGFYVLWLEYAKPLSGGHDAGGGLIEARPVRLWITSLDATGAAHGAPIALTPELADLEYDAVLWNGDP